MLVLSFSPKIKAGAWYACYELKGSTQARVHSDSSSYLFKGRVTHLLCCAIAPALTFSPPPPSGSCSSYYYLPFFQTATQGPPLRPDGSKGFERPSERLARLEREAAEGGGGSERGSSDRRGGGDRGGMGGGDDGGGGSWVRGGSVAGPPGGTPSLRRGYIWEGGGVCDRVCVCVHERERERQQVENDSRK